MSLLMSHAGSCASWDRRGAPFLWETKPMSQASLGNMLIGPYGLHALLGLMLALFAAFIYVFNFTSFF
jgi:hypothetical protein